ncbi:MAG TPA: tRNA (adenosine(37)-N6)-dimethylallyltransferase MiaA [Candidatus Saccharimonadales bacterium]|nr:tRNA (adenosine(37)-N6)-dimethylallyltransferase MiaA [Candidatus Saccharimonadales bacterium]
MNKPPLLVIVGETASGKTELALQLAQQLNGEIICADSWTVYKGFDIGTAKPTAEEQAQAPHHLLDVAEPLEGFSAPSFQRLAKAAILDITERGKLPIVVGGTGLYIDSLLYDYSFLPPSDPALRVELNSMSLEGLLNKAEALELDTDGIDLRNKRRVIRLIESNGVRPTKQELRENTVIIGVKRPAEELEQRIITRIDAMVAAGFPEEVQRLGDQYGWDIEPMRAPGYRAFADYVQGKISLDAAKERFRRNDLQLAKKQRTWFKRNKSIQWFSTPVNLPNLVEFITTNLNKQIGN